MERNYIILKHKFENGAKFSIRRVNTVPILAFEIYQVHFATRVIINDIIPIGGRGGIKKDDEG